MALTELLPKLKGVRRNGRGWMALCPAHEDRNQSLSVREQGDKILLYCHGGCRTEDILSAIGLAITDLFHDAGASLSSRRAASLCPVSYRETPNSA